MASQVAGDTAAGDPSDFRCDKLNDSEQREGERERPRQRVPELGTNLAMRSDAAWIVVGRTGDETGTELG